jgi:hypothetical protein
VPVKFAQAIAEHLLNHMARQDAVERLWTFTSLIPLSKFTTTGGEANAIMAAYEKVLRDSLEFL